MLRRAAIAAALVVAGSMWPAIAAAAGPVRLTVAFEPGARLGGATELNVDLRVDPRRRPSPVVAARLLYPRSLGLVSSGLGLATCRRPASDFAAVLIGSGPGLAGCPPNSVMGYGTAVAEVRLNDGQIIPEYATLSVLSAGIQDGNLGLVIFIDGQHPFGAKLILSGAVLNAPAPFGGALDVNMPSIPDLDATAVVALIRLSLSIGSRGITYYERGVAYHPEGVVLPQRCPQHGFRFRAELAFRDGGRATTETTVPCRTLAPATGKR